MNGLIWAEFCPVLKAAAVLLMLTAVRSEYQCRQLFGLHPTRVSMLAIKIGTIQHIVVGARHSEAWLCYLGTFDHISNAAQA